MGLQGRRRVSAHKKQIICKKNSNWLADGHTVFGIGQESSKGQAYFRQGRTVCLQFNRQRHTGTALYSFRTSCHICPRIKAYTRLLAALCRRINCQRCEKTRSRQYDNYAENLSPHHSGTWKPRHWSCDEVNGGLELALSLTQMKGDKVVNLRQ